MKPQDFSLLADALQEVSDVLEKLVTEHPDVFESMGIRYPLMDELGGYSYMVRDHVSAAQAVEASKAKPVLQQPPGNEHAHAFAVQDLAKEIIAALQADEKDGGYDLESGLFGPNFSLLVRRLAAAELNSLASAPAEPPPLSELQQDAGNLLSMNTIQISLVAGAVEEAAATLKLLAQRHPFVLETIGTRRTLANELENHAGMLRMNAEKDDCSGDDKQDDGHQPGM